MNARLKNAAVTAGCIYLGIAAWFMLYLLWDYEGNALLARFVCPLKALVWPYFIARRFF